MAIPDDVETAGADLLQGGAAAAASVPPRRVVLRAEGLVRGYGGHTVLAGIDLVLHAGEGVAILGHRNSGKSVLARVLAGLTPADAGHLELTAPAAPPVGSPTGFGTTGSVERDLGLRAAAYGIATREHVAEIARLLDDPGVLDLPFNRLDGVSRTLVTFGAGYLTPADVYVIDGLPVPQSPVARPRIEALFHRARRRAAVVWLTSAAGPLRAAAPDRCLLLEGGKLSELAGIAEAEARFLPRRGLGGSRPAGLRGDDTDDHEG